MVDVIGVGANSVDYVYLLPQFPQPEGPASKLHIARHLISCGGQTATTLSTCAAMGLRTKYIGATGNDDNGRRIREELERRGVDIAHAPVRDATNPFAVILLDERRGERVVLWDRQPSLQLRPDEIDAAVIRQARLVHVDDVDEEAAIRAASLAREAGIPVTTDIERVTARTEELVATASVAIFAEHVLEQLTGERDTERALFAAHRIRLPADTTSHWVCVTLGARGAMMVDGRQLYHEPGFRVKVVDTTGAGDVFRGAFIVAVLRGDPSADVVRFANAAAAISCARMGAMGGIPTVAEVRKLLAGERTTI